MALIATEGFDWISANSSLYGNIGALTYRNFPNNSGFGITPSSRSPGALGSLPVSYSTNVDSSYYASWQPIRAYVSGETLILGGAFKCHFNGALVQFFSLKASNSMGGINNVSVWLTQGASNSVRVYSNHGANSIYAYTPSNLLCQGNVDIQSDRFYFIELKVELGTTGKVYLRVDGVDVCSNLSCNTIGTGPISGIQFLGGVTSNPGGSSYTVDDIYICDGSGTTCNDFLGEISIRTLHPNADISSTSTPSTGSTGYGVIDETTFSATDYLTSTTNIGDRDEFGLTDLTVTSGTIYGVNAVAIADKDDSGDRSLKLYVKPNGGSSEDISSANSLTFGTISSTNVISETNPDTSNAWTISNVNNMNMGIEVA